MLLVTLVLAFIIRGLGKSINNIEIKYAKKGDDVFLDCPVNYPSGAKSIDVRWRRRDWKSMIYAFSQETLDQEYIAPIYEDRLIRSSGANLKLLKVQTSDQDMFTCEVTFNFGKVISSTHKISGPQQTSLFLIVNEKPVIVDMSPKSLIVKPDADVSLFCKVVGQPLPSVIWYRHNQMLPNQMRHNSEANENPVADSESKQYLKVPVLRNVISWHNLTKVNHGHSGDYKCVATNSEGSAEDIIRLKGSIYFIDKPIDKIIQMSETVIINCKATGDPNNITYHWYKNHRPIQMILNLEKRFHILKSGSLKIISVESFDGGEYMCVPSNGVQYRLSGFGNKISNETTAILKELKADVYATANITVYFKPIPHTMDHLIYLAINSNGFLPCSLTSNPVVKRIYWKKEGESNGIYRYVSGLQYKKHRNVFTNNTINTYFHEWDPVTKEDAGLYRCRGFNLMGNGDWSNVIQVIVKKSPYFITRPATMYKIASGENINIVCRSQGDPFPRTTWTFQNGTNIPETWTNGKDLGIFTIEKASSVHSNTYYCKATNPVKTIVARSLVVVVMVPNGPSDMLGPSNVTASCQLFSATVTWVMQVANGQFSVVDLLFKLSTEASWQRRPVLSTLVSHQTVFGLIPDELYQFCLMYRTRARDQFMSAVASCKTLGYRTDLVKHLPTDDHNNIIFPAIVKQLGPTPDPPSQIEVNITMDNKLSISWIPSGNISWPPILYYRVEYNNIPIDNNQLYSSFKLSIQKYQVHWQQLKPVLHPQTHYILPSTSVISSTSSLYGVLFRVRSYALLSVSKPSHSISIDRSLIDIIVANEREKSEIERSFASQNKWWPLIFWSLIALVFSSIVVLSVLIVARKCNFARFIDLNRRNPPRKESRTYKTSANLSNSKNYIIDSANDSYIVINNHNAHQLPATIKSDQLQNYLGDYVRLSGISTDSKRRRTVTDSVESSPGTMQLADPTGPSYTTSITESPDSRDFQKKFFHPVSKIKNDVNLYCNCHTYSPTVIVKNELIRSNKSQLMTEL